MPLTIEQRDSIAEDLKHCFETQYGDTWRTCLQKPLRPSPIHQIAQKYGVSVSNVRKIRRYWSLVGQILIFVDYLTLPIDESPTYES